MVRNYVRKRPKLYSDESMKAALIACKGPCGLTVRAAAKLWNIPFETLRGRHMGLHTSKRPGPKNVLTMSEESDIALAAITMANAGQPMGRSMLKDLVRTYLERQGRVDDVRFINGTPGIEWVSFFNL
jgi:hypothetical protein